jgi:hypothetical protein
MQVTGLAQPMEVKLKLYISGGMSRGFQVIPVQVGTVSDVLWNK